MKLNIYYGGRGMIEDPTLHVIDKLTEVLTELNVKVTRYNLYEQKGNIAMLPNTLKEADAAVIAVSVEWYGIGGFMQQFLDACWMYGDKEKIKKLYMFPVVISTSLGEREAEYSLIRSWELLGGTVYPGICAYVENHISFETNAAYTKLIEEQASDIYRKVQRKGVAFPSSTCAGGVVPASGTTIELTPQESAQLSEYVSDEKFVTKQKADVEQLTKLYRNKLDHGKEEDKQEFVAEFRKAFVAPEAEFSAIYQIIMTDTERNLVAEVENGALKVYYGVVQNPSMIGKTTREVINRLVEGHITFQGSFMQSQVVCKGDFKLVRRFDEIFRFD